MSASPYSLTWSGKKFHVQTPSVDEICIEDIAHHLSRICRFNGAIDAEHYSVAQHSVLVSHVSPSGHALCGLLHDASEAYYGDVIRPVKGVIGWWYEELERNCALLIRNKFDVCRTYPWCVHAADMSVYVSEVRDLRPGLICDINAPPYGFEIKPVNASAAKEMFLARFEELKGNHNGVTQG